MSEPEIADGKTGLRRIEQFRDRWSTGSSDSGLLAISEKPSSEKLRQYEIFAPYDDAFLEKISPDVAIANWQEGTVLFEEGAYIDLAFFVASGEVEVFVDRERPDGGGAQPIFDLGRTVINLPVPGSSAQAPEKSQPALSSTMMVSLGLAKVTASPIVACWLGTRRSAAYARGANRAKITMHIIAFFLIYPYPANQRLFEKVFSTSCSEFWVENRRESVVLVTLNCEP